MAAYSGSSNFVPNRVLNKMMSLRPYRWVLWRSLSQDKSYAVAIFSRTFPYLRILKKQKNRCQLDLGKIIYVSKFPNGTTLINWCLYCIQFFCISLHIIIYYCIIYDIIYFILLFFQIIQDTQKQEYRCFFFWVWAISFTCWFCRVKVLTGKKFVSNFLLNNNLIFSRKFYLSIVLEYCLTI